MKTDNDLMARKIGILKEFLPALLPKYKIMLLEAFSPHDLLTAYIKNTLSDYPRLEDQNLDDLTVELLYPTDEAAEHCIKEFLALRLDDDNEHELEQCCEVVIYGRETFGCRLSLSRRCFFASPRNKAGPQ